MAEPIPGLVHTISGFLYREPIGPSYHRFLEFYADREVDSELQVDPLQFQDYGLGVMALIEALGWEFLANRPPLPICPEAVRLFYSNMECQGGKLTTLVHGHMLTIRPSALAALLDIPVQGLSLYPVDDSFDIEKAYRDLTGKVAPVPYPTYFPRYDLVSPAHQIMHFFITHIFLPRRDSPDLVLPIDLWILHNATRNQKVDYSSLLFNEITRASDVNYVGNLPFGGIITKLLQKLTVRISGYLMRSSCLTLTARTVLIGLSLIRHDPIPPEASSSRAGGLSLAPPLEVVVIDSDDEGDDAHPKEFADAHDGTLELMQQLN